MPVTLNYAVRLLVLAILLPSCASMATRTDLSFSSAELKDCPPGIFQTVEYWEKNGLRTTPAVERQDILRGFLLEYGNSNFKDYNSLIGLETEKGIRVFVNKQERSPSEDQINKIRVIFDKFISSAGCSGGKNIDPFVFDGTIYLVSLETKEKVTKFPYYAPRLETKDSPEILLLDALLAVDTSLRTNMK